MFGQSMTELHSSYCEPGVHVTTDASGAWGCRASWLDHSVAAQEMLPTVLASAICGDHTLVRVCLIITTRC